jgi:hypothetical protein
MYALNRKSNLQSVRRMSEAQSSSLGTWMDFVITLFGQHFGDELILFVKFDSIFSIINIERMFPRSGKYFGKGAPNKSRESYGH